MDVIIIGAGASGLMAAITAANQGAKVTRWKSITSTTSTRS